LRKSLTPFRRAHVGPTRSNSRHFSLPKGRCAPAADLQGIPQFRIPRGRRDAAAARSPRWVERGSEHHLRQDSGPQSTGIGEGKEAQNITCVWTQGLRARASGRGKRLISLPGVTFSPSLLRSALRYKSAASASEITVPAWASARENSPLETELLLCGYLGFTVLCLLPSAERV
jgi:hypothetical protein